MKIRRTDFSSISKQKGVAFLLFIVVVITSVLVFIASDLDKIKQKNTNIKETYQKLNEAKQNLIAYAVNYTEYYNSNVGLGHFPCPDWDNDGDPDTPCDDLNEQILRLPLFVDPNSPGATFQNQRISITPSNLSEEQFWYVISNNFMNNPSGPVNSETQGTLTLNGIPNIVAIIFAPGNGMTTAQANGRPSNNVNHYLEGENSDGDLIFSTNQVNSNDKAVYITTDEFMGVVENRLINTLVNIVTSYRDNCGVGFPQAMAYEDPKNVANFTSNAANEGLFPLDTAAPTNWGAACAGNIPNWINNNNWGQLLYYDIRGGLTFDGAINREAVIMLAGSELAGQDRANFSGRQDYFEDENDDGDTTYETFPGNQNTNDTGASIGP